jgi:hypothetical protein
MNNILNRIGEEDSRIDYYLSSRSKLYNLEPIGIGTPFAECLTSYISRLANEHNVSVNTLVKMTIAPEIEKPYLRNNLLQGVYGTTPRYLNGNSQVSIDYVHVIEKLTCRKDVIYLTMNMVSGIFSQNVIYSNRRWCPLCLNKWQQSKNVIYEPLIWHLSDIKKCELHELELQEECPTCHKKQSFMHSKFVVGYCQHCNSWLGEEECDKLIKSSLTEDEQFTISNYKQLIEKSPNMSYMPTHTSISTTLTSIKNQMNFSSNSKFAEFLGVHPSHLRIWMVNKQLPSSKSLLNISKCIGSSIFSLFYVHKNDKLQANYNKV